MRRLFRSFERARLDYLLISGQASILYGAATFSEDVDLWIRPTPSNARRLLAALAARRARVYKLTPPLSRRNLAAGHGFHFLVPSRPAPIYLDIMGRPPRVGPFAAARKRARVLRTAWGDVPVVSIPDLIALKRTQRIADYEVISGLARIAVSGVARPTRTLLAWAARNSYRAEERAGFLRALGRTVALEPLRRGIAREIASLQARDAAYWRRIIRDLRRLRHRGGLLPDGIPVADLLRR